MPSQSALTPAGQAAQEIADLFWLMTFGGAAIWLGVMAILLYAVTPRRQAYSAGGARRLAIVAGLVIPAVTLSALLVNSLSMLPRMLAAAPAGALHVSVAGQQWWWRVHYAGEGRTVVPVANEIRLPAGRPIEFTLTSSDVIHSFWIPPLGGKIDMIPGRQTRLLLEPLKEGVYRGVCAEYCGASHALMAFVVVVLEPAAFSEWLEGQARPADEPAAGSAAARGRDVFLSSGCGACHSVRGTMARGSVAPDLTHIASRHTLGAGVGSVDQEAIRQWIANPHLMKPGVSMPGFGMLPAADLHALAAYLEGLR